MTGRHWRGSRWECSDSGCYCWVRQCSHGGVLDQVLSMGCLGGAWLWMMPCLPPDYGFIEHKEQVMVVTQQEMKDAQLTKRVLCPLLFLAAEVQLRQLPQLSGLQVRAAWLGHESTGTTWITWKEFEHEWPHERSLNMSGDSSKGRSRGKHSSPRAGRWIGGPSGGPIGITSQPVDLSVMFNYCFEKQVKTNNQKNSG